MECKLSWLCIAAVRAVQDAEWCRAIQSADWYIVLRVMQDGTWWCSMVLRGAAWWDDGMVDDGRRDIKGDGEVIPAMRQRRPVQGPLLWWEVMPQPHRTTQAGKTHASCVCTDNAGPMRSSVITHSKHHPITPQLHTMMIMILWGQYYEILCVWYQQSTKVCTPLTLSSSGPLVSLISLPLVAPFFPLMLYIYIFLLLLLR